MQIEDLKDSTFQCIHFLSSIEIPPMRELSESGLKTFEIDGSSLSSQRDLLNSLARAFSFPDYVELNWEAADEFLADLSWATAGGYVLLLRHTRQLWAKSPESAGRLIECWLYAAEIWADEDIPFHLIFVVED